MNHEYLDDFSRLSSLQALGILDTPAEKIYDDLVFMVATLTESPISVISLVDKDRQWFKAKYGLKANQTPREHSICAHCLLGNEPFIVQDTLEDPRFSSNPLVTQAPFIRFYAGAPLILSNGHRIGSLCVIDIKPKKLNAFQISALTTISQWVIALVESQHKEQLRAEATSVIENQKIQIMKTSKMSALGEMAAGVAHEINTPLAAIVAYAGELQYLAVNSLITPENVQLNSQKIEHTAMRIAKIVKALKSFSRDGDTDASEPVEIIDIMDDTLELCKERIRQKGVQIHFKPPDESFKIKCKAIQIGQVILNLINNSLDAIEQLEEKWIKIDYKKTESYTEISVTDSGHGIPEPHQQQLMRPFFTTKPIGKGTGLGLSISQRILHAHQGSLLLDKNSKNTRFVITIPN